MTWSNLRCKRNRLKVKIKHYALSRLSTKLKATSGTICEIEEQMEIADDLEKDFKLTQMKMKARRKKGHELNGYRKNEIASKIEDSIRAEKEREKEIRAKEASQKGFWDGLIPNHVLMLYYYFLLRKLTRRCVSFLVVFVALRT